MQVDVLLDQEVQHLSGGELQRVAITMCLGKPADIYLIDEPSAYLDSEQRIVAAKVSTHAGAGPGAMPCFLVKQPGHVMQASTCYVCLQSAQPVPR